MKPNVAPWLKGLLDLRPRFDSLADEDLRYLMVRRDMDFATANERYQVEELEFLPTPSWVDWRERRPILFDQARHDTFHGKDIVCRHILFGRIQSGLLQKFLKWSEEAGLCLAARPTAEPGKTGSNFTWFEYICQIAILHVSQCPLKAKYECVAELPSDVESAQVHCLRIPVTIARASVSIIDFIEEYFGNGYHVPGSIDGPTEKRQRETVAISHGPEAASSPAPEPEGVPRVPSRQTRLKAHLQYKHPYLTLDGEQVRDVSDVALAFVAALIEADGHDVSFRAWLGKPENVGKYSGAVVSRVLDSLPPCLASFVLRRGKGQSPRLIVEELRQAQ